MNAIKVGNKIEWTSAAGTIVGEITEITIAPAADKSMQPWFTISYFHEVAQRNVSVQLHAGDSSLKMYKVKILG